MVVGVDQPGHYQAAPGVNGAVHLVLVSGELAHVDDVVALDENTAVLDEAVLSSSVTRCPLVISSDFMSCFADSGQEWHRLLHALQDRVHGSLLRIRACPAGR